MTNVRRARGKGSDSGINPWLGYTDVLSSMLLIVLLAMGLVTLAKALNEKPPLISLTETEDVRFRFPTGSYGLSQDFLNALDRKYVTEVKPQLEAWDVDVIEVIGHTDGQPSGRRVSNLDWRLQTVAPQGEFTKFAGVQADSDADLGLLLGGGGALAGVAPGSNADLGLLRAMAVGQYLQVRLEQDQLPVRIRPYSAASLLDPQGNFNPAPAVDDDTRRRIELRFTRSS